MEEKEDRGNYFADFSRWNGTFLGAAALIFILKGKKVKYYAFSCYG